MKRGRRGGSRKMKRERHNQNDNGVGGDDRLSDLPDEILLNIMSFLMIRDAVQTCILSKRWKHLWKCIPDITVHASDYSRHFDDFFEFVFGFVTCLDSNDPLNSLDFSRRAYLPDQILTSLMRYAVSHGIQKLRIHVPYSIRLPSFVFPCRSLTSLDISVSSCDWGGTRIPKSIELPALVSLRIENVASTTDENGDAEPFSTCTKLNTLTVDHLQLLARGSEVRKKVALIISNAKLANLTINKYYGHYIVVSTPNLSSFALNGSPFQKLRTKGGMNIELQSSSLA